MRGRPLPPPASLCSGTQLYVFLIVNSFVGLLDNQLCAWQKFQASLSERTPEGVPVVSEHTQVASSSALSGDWQYEWSSQFADLVSAASYDANGFDDDEEKEQQPEGGLAKHGGSVKSAVVGWLCVCVPRAACRACVCVCAWQILQRCGQIESSSYWCGQFVVFVVVVVVAAVVSLCPPHSKRPSMHAPRRQVAFEGRRTATTHGCVYARIAAYAECLCRQTCVSRLRARQRPRAHRVCD